MSDQKREKREKIDIHKRGKKRCLLLLLIGGKY